MIKNFVKKNYVESREANGSREAQMVWTICVGFAVILAALFQVNSPRKLAIPPRMIPTDYGVAGSVQNDSPLIEKIEKTHLVRQTASNQQN